MLLTQIASLEQITFFGNSAISANYIWLGKETIMCNFARCTKSGRCANSAISDNHIWLGKETLMCNFSRCTKSGRCANSAISAHHIWLGKETLMCNFPRCTKSGRCASRAINANRLSVIQISKHRPSGQAVTEFHGVKGPDHHTTKKGHSNYM